MPSSSSSDIGGENQSEIVFVPASHIELADQESIVPKEVVVDPETEVSKGNRAAFWGMAKKAIGDVSIRVSSTGVAVATQAASLGSSGVAKAAELGKQTYIAAGNASDATGATQAIKATASAVSGKLDEVSGKRLVELLEQKLRVQDSYNDIIATRLAEALERIAVLEARISQLTSETAALQRETQ